MVLPDSGATCVKWSDLSELQPVMGGSPPALTIIGVVARAAPNGALPGPVRWKDTLPWSGWSQSDLMRGWI